jgi:hypothetical protein
MDWIGEAVSFLTRRKLEFLRARMYENMSTISDADLSEMTDSVYRQSVASA